MMRLLFLLALFFTLTGCNDKEDEIEIPEPKTVSVSKESVYKFDPYFSESGTSAVRTMDGGYVIAADLKSFHEELGGDLILLKYNAAGDLLWEKQYIDKNTNQYVLEIIESRDGNLLVASNLVKVGYMGLPTLSKFDPSGNLLWETSREQSNEDRIGLFSGVSVIESMDGNFLMAGNNSFHQSNPYYPDSDFSLFKISPLGKLLSLQTFGQLGNIEHAWTLTENNKGDIMLVGTSAGATHGDGQMKLIKINTLGEVVLEKVYGGPATDIPNSIVKTSDGNLVIGGYSESFVKRMSIWLIKVNWEGDVIWEKRYEGDEAYVWASGPSAITEDKNQNLLIAGAISFLDSRPFADMYALKTDKQGEKIWDIHLNSTETHVSFDGATSIMELTGGEIVLVGYKEDEENPWFNWYTRDLWVVHLKEK